MPPEAYTVQAVQHPRRPTRRTLRSTKARQGQGQDQRNGGREILCQRWKGYSVSLYLIQKRRRTTASRIEFAIEEDGSHAQRSQELRNYESNGEHGIAGP